MTLPSIICEILGNVFTDNLYLFNLFIIKFLLFLPIEGIARKTKLIFFEIINFSKFDDEYTIFPEKTFFCADSTALMILLLIMITLSVMASLQKREIIHLMKCFSIQGD